MMCSLVSEKFVSALFFSSLSSSTFAEASSRLVRSDSGVIRFRFRQRVSNRTQPGMAFVFLSAHCVPSPVGKTLDTDSASLTCYNHHIIAKLFCVMQLALRIVPMVV